MSTKRAHADPIATCSDHPVLFLAATLAAITTNRTHFCTLPTVQLRTTMRATVAGLKGGLGYGLGVLLGAVLYSSLGPRLCFAVFTAFPIMSLLLLVAMPVLNAGGGWRRHKAGKKGLEGRENTKSHWAASVSGPIFANMF